MLQGRLARLWALPIGKFPTTQQATNFVISLEGYLDNHAQWPSAKPRKLTLFACTGPCSPELGGY